MVDVLNSFGSHILLPLLGYIRTYGTTTSTPFSFLSSFIAPFIIIIIILLLFIAINFHYYFIIIFFSKFFIIIYYIIISISSSKL